MQHYSPCTIHDLQSKLGRTVIFCPGYSHCGLFDLPIKTSRMFSEVPLFIPSLQVRKDVKDLSPCLHKQHWKISRQRCTHSPLVSVIREH